MRRSEKLAWIKQKWWVAAGLLVGVLSAVRADERDGGNVGDGGNGGDGWKRALPGWTYAFPRDHFDHSDFKTEWWYFTGHLKENGGKQRTFGFQVTFFRQGVRPPGSRNPVHSRFVRDHFYFGHFAISDLNGRRFFFTQEVSRGAFGEAAARAAGKPGDRIVWLNDWILTLTEDGAFRSRTVMKKDGVALDVKLKPSKPYVMHGEDGVSQKAAGAGNASHYYSCTRMTTNGKLKLGGETIDVSGEAWLDREWATNQLAKDQAGWDWFSLQFEDGSELMVYQLRRVDGSADPASSGTWVSPDGSATHLASGDFTLTRVTNAPWKSKVTGATYPLHWQVSVPSKKINVKTVAMMDGQELALPPLTYWEGAVEASGSHAGKGYMELTGYGGDVSALTGNR